MAEPIAVTFNMKGIVTGNDLDRINHHDLFRLIPCTTETGRTGRRNKWTMLLRKNFDTQDINVEYLGVYVELTEIIDPSLGASAERPSESVRISFLIEKNNQSMDGALYKSKVVRFTENSFCGIDDMIGTTELDNGEYRSAGGNVTVRCKISYLTPEEQSKYPKSASGEPKRAKSNTPDPIEPNKKIRGDEQDEASISTASQSSSESISHALSSSKVAGDSSAVSSITLSPNTTSDSTNTDPKSSSELISQDSTSSIPEALPADTSKDTETAKGNSTSPSSTECGNLMNGILSDALPDQNTEASDRSNQFTPISNDSLSASPELPSDSTRQISTPVSVAETLSSAEEYIVLDDTEDTIWMYTTSDESSDDSREISQILQNAGSSQSRTNMLTSQGSDTSSDLTTPQGSDTSSDSQGTSSDGQVTSSDSQGTSSDGQGTSSDGQASSENEKSPRDCSGDTSPDDPK